VRRVISRRNPVKTMFMGVVFQPQPEHDFDGKITMKRISRSRQLERDTYRVNKFHYNYHVNQLIMDGDWKNLHDDPTFTATELLTLVADYYELDDDVAEALCLRYVTHVGGERNRRTITMRGNETIPEIFITTLEGNQRALTIDDVTISCFYPRGSIIKEEVTCNSRFMLETMPTIGAKICRNMPWVPHEQPIYLIMDNAGGHGTREAVGRYTRALRNQFNVIIKQRPARSPELNALDLGIWMSLQSAVEKMHRNARRDAEVLTITVQEAWRDLPADTIQRVFNRIPVVYQLIVESGGGNINVEERRGRRNIAVAPEG
jgi:hypothetical protein